MFYTRVNKLIIKRGEPLLEKKKITIKEIAQKSGVSVSTVSRVLNDSPSVNEAKRKKIQAVIDEFDYQPSMFARGMISNKTHTLAVIVSDITNPYFTELVAEINQFSKIAGYSILLFNTMSAGSSKFSAAYESEVAIFKTIIEKQVDGVIILGGEVDQEKIAPAYAVALNQLSYKIPTVVIGQKHVAIDCTFIERNLTLGTTMVTQHLLALGNKKIGFIGGEPGVTITGERLNAFKKTLSIYSHVEERYIILNDYYAKDGYVAMQELLAQGDLPEAIVTINDAVALGAIRALVDAGKNCPKDIAIASCDQFSTSAFSVPRLTSINQHNDFLGRVAIKTLTQLIDETVDEIVFDHRPELVINESCGAKLK